MTTTIGEKEKIIVLVFCKRTLLFETLSGGSFFSLWCWLKQLRLNK